MRKGAFAMFDALGTRGVWRRHDPAKVLAKFERLEREFNALLQKELGGPNFEGIRNDDNIIEDISIAFLSDTVIVGVIPKQPAWRAPNEYGGFSVILAARFAGIAMRMAA